MVLAHYQFDKGKKALAVNRYSNGRVQGSWHSCGENSRKTDSARAIPGRAGQGAGISLRGGRGASGSGDHFPRTGTRFSQPFGPKKRRRELRKTSEKGPVIERAKADPLTGITHFTNKYRKACFRDANWGRQV